MKGFCDECGCDIEVSMCCNGFQCGCMGQPIDPPLCEKEECWDKYMTKLGYTKKK